MVAGNRYFEGGFFAEYLRIPTEERYACLIASGMADSCRMSPLAAIAETFFSKGLDVKEPSKLGLDSPANSVALKSRSKTGNCRCSPGFLHT